MTEATLPTARQATVDRPRGRIKEQPEDFVVEELPAYLPSGAGEHVFVRLTKRNVTTLDVARALARACGCEPREAGFAGMKDKRAVATQTISLHAPPGVAPRDVAERARSCALEGVTVHEANLHGNKLKPGHLTGNRFTLRVRGVDRTRWAEVERALARVKEDGIPNAFGAQRYGRDGDNVARALAWLRGEERGPGDPRVRRLLWSSLQASVFDAVLEARLEDGTWNRPALGDLLKLRESGGLFLCTAVQNDAERAARGEVSPTGPIIGARMRWPEGAPGDLERAVTDAKLGAGFDLARTRSLGAGSRRALRMWVEDLRWEVVDENPGKTAVGVQVYFVLAKGGYATTVLGAALRIDSGADDDAAAPVGDVEETTGDPDEAT